MNTYFVYAEHDYRTATARRAYRRANDPAARRRFERALVIGLVALIPAGMIAADQFNGDRTGETPATQQPG